MGSYIVTKNTMSDHITATRVHVTRLSMSAGTEMLHL